MIIDCHTHIGAELGIYLAGGFPYGQHLVDLVHQGREQGIDRWVVFPMVTNLALNLDSMRHGVVDTAGAFESVPYAWENRRMMDEVTLRFPDEGRSAIPFAMFDPGRNTRGQAAALRTLFAEAPFCGLKTQPTMIESPITALNDAGQVFLELATEWDLPVLIHSSVLPADVWSQASDIIDIAENWPQVRFCVAHSCRFDVECLQRIAALDNCWFDCSAHGIHCELATQDSPVVAPPERRFASDYTRPAQVLADLAVAFPDKLLWGSDAPYYSFVAQTGDERLALISTYALEAGYFHALSPEHQARAGYANTLKFLGRPAAGRL